MEQKRGLGADGKPKSSYWKQKLRAESLEESLRGVRKEVAMLRERVDQVEAGLGERISREVRENLSVVVDANGHNRVRVSLRWEVGRPYRDEFSEDYAKIWQAPVR